MGSGNVETFGLEGFTEGCPPVRLGIVERATGECEVAPGRVWVGLGGCGKGDSRGSFQGSRFGESRLDYDSKCRTPDLSLDGRIPGPRWWRIPTLGPLWRDEVSK